MAAKRKIQGIQDEAKGFAWRLRLRALFALAALNSEIA
jgi:hypothetical protein